MPIAPQAPIGRGAISAGQVDPAISKKRNWCARKINREARAILEHLNYVRIVPLVHVIDRGTYSPYWNFSIIHQRPDRSGNRLRANERQITLNIDEPVR